ncbi:hypothetical protein [Pedobacter gandavensis]|uniref:tetratricopeptide repeat protein n=1 Tax=Pedobacter gandavensis TaxID=2679963 RepID=UPI00293186CA|nr:hypothetical protein [Pedobacter gandavensis]
MTPQNMPNGMKLSVIILITILFNTLLISCVKSQTPQKTDQIISVGKFTSQQWKEEAKTDIGLLPKYGNLPKSEAQKDADNKLINNLVQQEGSRSKASAALIKLGFNYIYQGEIKTAMYRFNQAWLLDSTNVDIYWGFGAIYHYLGDEKSATEQYDKGLSINPKNSKIITDKATLYLMGYYEKNDIYKLNNAIVLLEESYVLNSKNQNTLFKLSICYFLQNDCKKAKKYYIECMNLGGKPITIEYTNALNEKCKDDIKID